MTWSWSAQAMAAALPPRGLRAPGLSVCVIERGREFVTGEFPSRLPELRRELQIVGEKMRSGRRTGLFDFRLGTDIHVLIGCGLGGGSLINAAVGLRPDAARLCRSRLAWRGEGGRAARSGLRQGERPCCGPTRYAKASDFTKYRALEAASGCFGRSLLRRPSWSASRRLSIPQASSSLPARFAAIAARAAMSAPRTPWRSPIFPTPRPMALRSSPSSPSSHVEKEDAPLARSFRADRGTRRGPALGRSQDRGAVRRHARLDRNSAPLARRGAAASPTGSASASPPMATSSPLRSAARNA